MIRVCNEDASWAIEISVMVSLEVRDVCPVVDGHCLEACICRIISQSVFLFEFREHQEEEQQEERYEPSISQSMFCGG
jgi:hypothetical protein